jgi:tetratricopeptide (TPR) repeat protein
MSADPTAPTSPADGLPPEALAELLSPAPTGISPGELPSSVGERFEVRGLLGEGGQGVVLAVRDRRLEREIAAKIPRRGMPGAEEHLEREARLAASLEHPNILPTYDLAESPDGGPLMLMRRAPGRSLEDALRACEERTGVAGGPLSGLAGRAARIRVFLQLAEAIGYAHSRGILHLDLKPANVRVGDFGEVFVMDWGMARRVTESSAPVGGTPPYMAPELLEGLSPDERADVYSLGVTLYRMLSGGAVPYDGDVSSTAAYRTLLTHARPVPLGERVVDIDPDLAAVVDKACRRERGMRYRKVRDLVADVEAALDGRPVTARKSSLPELIAKWARRHRRGLGYAAAVIVILGVSGAFFEERRRRAAADRLRARARVPLDKGWELALRVPPDHAAAERQYTRALEIDPSFAWAHYARGRSRQALNMHDAALRDLRRAAELDASLIMARYHAGRIYMEDRRNVEAARKQFAAMRGLDPDNEYSMLGEGWLATVEGKWDEALRLADLAEKANPDFADVYDLRGYVWSALRSPKRSPARAVAAYSRFLQAMPHSVTALNNRGYALIQLGRLGEAERDLDRALELDPDYIYALTNRGSLLTRRGELAGAIRDLDRAQRLNPGYIWIYLNRGAAYELLGNYERAREDYVTATGLDEDSALPYRRRAMLEMRAGDFLRAMETYGTALELCSPEVANTVRRRLGMAAYYAGSYEDAERIWRLDLRRRAAGTRLYSGLLLWRLLTELGRAEEADAMLSELRAEDKEKEHLRAVAGYCLRRTGEGGAFEGAEGPGELCEIFYYMGGALAAWGELERAEGFFRASWSTGYRSYAEHLLAETELSRLGAAAAEQTETTEEIETAEPPAEAPDEARPEEEKDAP